MMCEVTLRDGTRIVGERIMGPPSGPPAVTVQNSDGWHYILLEHVVMLREYEAAP